MKKITRTNIQTYTYYVGDESGDDRPYMTHHFPDVVREEEEEVTLAPDILKKLIGGGIIKTQYQYGSAILLKSNPVRGRVFSAVFNSATDTAPNIRLEVVSGAGTDWKFAWIAPFDHYPMQIAADVAKNWLKTALVPDDWEKFENRYYGV